MNICTRLNKFPANSFFPLIFKFDCEWLFLSHSKMLHSFDFGQYRLHFKIDQAEACAWSLLECLLSFACGYIYMWNHDSFCVSLCILSSTSTSKRRARLIHEEAGKKMLYIYQQSAGFPCNYFSKYAFSKLILIYWQTHKSRDQF